MKYCVPAKSRRAKTICALILLTLDGPLRIPAKQNYLQSLDDLGAHQFTHAHVDSDKMNDISRQIAAAGPIDLPYRFLMPPSAPTQGNQLDIRVKAASLLEAGRVTEALDLARYIITTRLGDKYWFEALPTHLKSANALKLLDDEFPFLLEQTLRNSIEYPEHSDEIQDALLVGVVEGLMELGRHDLAINFATSIISASLSVRLRRTAGSYLQALKTGNIESATSGVTEEGG